MDTTHPPTNIAGRCCEDGGLNGLQSALSKAFILLSVGCVEKLLVVRSFPSTNQLLLQFLQRLRRLPVRQISTTTVKTVAVSPKRGFVTECLIVWAEMMNGIAAVSHLFTTLFAYKWNSFLSLTCTANSWCIVLLKWLDIHSQWFVLFEWLDIHSR